EALTAAFARRTERTGFCVLSSVKSNIGHLDSAAGAAGLLKAVVALRSGRRYASAHFTEPNPLLDTSRSALRLSTRTEPWEGVAQRRAGVSAFGLTGTNVHLVLEQAPVAPRETPAGDRRLLVPLSARGETALRRHAARLAAHLRAHPEPAALADLAFVQATGRDHERWRARVTAATPAPAAPARLPLLSHEDATEPGAASAWTGAFPALADWRAERTAGVAAAEATAAERDAAERLVDRLIPVRALFEAGVPDRIVIGHG